MLIGASVGCAIGAPKGRSVEGLALGLFLGFIGWIIVAGMEPTAEIRQTRAAEIAKALSGTVGISANEPTRTCPWCAEKVKAAARVCRFCNRDLEPLSSSELATANDAALGEYSLAAVESAYPNTHGVARPYLDGLPVPPSHPGLWLRELCDRIQNGSPPSAAAANIPLNWSKGAPEMVTPTPTIGTPEAPSDFLSIKAQYPREYDSARAAMAGLGAAPVYPELWLAELCRRVSAGSPPDAAAARIPNDFA